MAVSHIKNVTIADFTGTVTVFNSAGATETANATDIVRPSDWNSVHNQFFTLTGNTNNASTASGSNVIFSGGNGVTLIGSNNTIGWSVANQSVQTQNMVSVLGSTGNISFANGNGITFGGNASTITASHNGLTSQSNQAFSAGGGSSAFQTLGFSDANGVTFTNTNGSVGASVRTDYASSVHGHTDTIFATGNTTQSSSGTLPQSSMIFQGTGIVSVGVSNGSIVVSGTQSNQAFSAAGGSSAFQTLGFSDGNGVSFTNTNGSVGATVRTDYASSNHSHGATLFAASNTTQSSSGTMNISSMIFAGAGIASVGVTNGSVVVSVPSGGGAGDGGVFAGVSNLGNTAGSTGTVSTGNFVLVGSGAISLSQSTAAAGSHGTVSILAPATSSLVGVSPISISTNGSTISVIYSANQQSFFWALPPGASTAVSQVGNGTIAVYPVIREGDFTASRADIFASMSVSSSSNSSHAGALSVYVGLYTRNGSTLSLASSGSQSYQWTNTSNNSLGSIASLRQFSVPINVNYSDGKDLWVAVMTRSSTTNANWFTGSNVLQSYNFHSAQLVGLIGEASNATRGQLGAGRFSASSSVLPGSMGFTQITGGMGGTASASRLMPNVYFMNFTA